MSLDIIIGTYLAVVRDYETVFTVGGRTYACIPLEHASHPLAKARGWKISPYFLRRKTALTLLVLFEQPAVNPKDRSETG
jgi:hypothetical protein